MYAFLTTNWCKEWIDGAIVIFAERWLIFDDPSPLCLIAIFEDKEFFNSFAKVACHTKGKDC